MPASARKEKEYLFVYGTLRRDTGNGMHQLLAQHATFVGSGNYQGLLYGIDYYPGAVPSDDPHDHVFGDIYCLTEPDRVLVELDRYEECGLGFSEPAEYIRIRQEIRLQCGDTLSAWVYVYNRPTDHLPLLSSGNFLDR